MTIGQCNKCGLRAEKSGKEICHLTGQAPVVELVPCPSFIELQMDGDEPFSPEQHLMMKKDLDARQGMKRVQGMRF